MRRRAPARRRAAASSAETNRHGSRTPSPAQSSRAAFSAMSPLCGTARTRHAALECADDRAVAGVADHQRGVAHRVGVGHPVDQPGTGVRRGSAQTRDAGRVDASTRTSQPAQALQTTRGAAADPDRGRWTGRPPPAAASPGGGETAGAGGSQSIGPTTCTAAGHSRGYSSCGKVATRQRSGAEAAVQPVERRQPKPPARLVQLVAALAQTPARAAARTCPRSARPARVRGSRAPIE